MSTKFKEGDGWKACYDSSTGRYTAERKGFGYYDLYEITEEIFSALADGMRDDETYKLIDQGRHLYMDVNDRCGPPYTIIFDDDYKELCPWAHIVGGEHVWPKALTDAAVELFESEKPNREYRKKKRSASKEDADMAIGAKTIGAFGVSFSRGMDQSWVNMWRKDDGFMVEFFQNFEDMDSDEDDEIISVNEKISIELGEEILDRAFADGQLDQWQTQYGADDEGQITDLSWTIDVDDNTGADLMLLSGNRKLPPNDWMAAVVQAVRLGEDRFMRCVREFR